MTGLPPRWLASPAVVAAALLFNAATGMALDVATEKPNYLPGETVTVTGNRWRPHETVSLLFEKASSERASFQGVVTAGADGGFRDASFTVQEADRDELMTMAARGASGAVVMVAFRNGVAPGSLKCAGLAPQDTRHYGVSAGQNLTCTIEGATDLSPAQQAGTEPVEVMLKGRTLGRQLAKVVSVSGSTITFAWTPPEGLCESTTVSYGPIRACSRSTGKCAVFPTEGNDANNMIVSAGSRDSGAGFVYLEGCDNRMPCLPSGQLQVEKKPKNGAFLEGSQVSYSIVVSNPSPSGSGTVGNVRLTDELPGNGALVWEKATTSRGVCEDPVRNNLLNCSLGNIGPQESVTVTVNSSATTPPAACQSQPNLAAVATGDGGITARDSGSFTCTPTFPPQLGVALNPRNSSFTQGAQAGYSIVIGNPAAAGSRPAKNVQLTQQLPATGNLTWTSVSSTAGSCTISGNSLSCSLGDIAPQGEVTVTVKSTPTTPPEACQDQPVPAAVASAGDGLIAQDSGSLSCTPPVPAKLKVVKSPKGGTFVQGGQVTYSIEVSNPAAAGSAPATNVQLTDPLYAYGGLTFTSVKTSQGACALSKGLNCSLGSIPAASSALVTVSTPATTPLTACTWQPGTAAVATADGALTARDVGSVYCQPYYCTINGVTIGNTSWNSFDAPETTPARVWVHAHIGKAVGVPKTYNSSVYFRGGYFTLSNGTRKRLPDGAIYFDVRAERSSTTYDAGRNQWVTRVNPNNLSDEIFFTGMPIEVTPSVAQGAKATWSFDVQSDNPDFSFSWQWSGAVYTNWPDNWNNALIQPDHNGYHAGAPTSSGVQQSLIQGPRGGAGSNFTGSWSATGNGVCIATPLAMEPD